VSVASPIGSGWIEGWLYLAALLANRNYGAAQPMGKRRETPAKGLAEVVVAGRPAWVGVGVVERGLT